MGAGCAGSGAEGGRRRLAGRAQRGRTDTGAAAGPLRAGPTFRAVAERGRRRGRRLPPPPSPEFLSAPSRAPVLRISSPPSRVPILQAVPRPPCRGLPPLSSASWSPQSPPSMSPCPFRPSPVGLGRPRRRPEGVPALPVCPGSAFLRNPRPSGNEDLEGGPAGGRCTQ